LTILAGDRKKLLADAEDFTLNGAPPLAAWASPGGKNLIIFEFPKMQENIVL